jgi:hypothetical protein
MTEDEQARPHDVATWPHGSLPGSLIVGLGVVVIGVALTLNAENVRASAAGLLIGLVAGSSSFVFFVRRWQATGRVSVVACLISLILTIGGIYVFEQTGATGPGGVFLAGLFGGMMLTNVWAFLTVGAKAKL